LICFLKGYKFVVMDVPLLFEGPMYKIMQKIVVVHRIFWLICKF
jgi:dephospho-CoA kinase